jgi:hypothetical protein
MGFSFVAGLIGDLFPAASDHGIVSGRRPRAAIFTDGGRGWSGVV